MTMKTIILLTENWDLFDPRDLSGLIDAAKIAEDAGIDGVSVSEHIVLGPAAGAGTSKRNPREFDMPGNQPPDTTHPSLVAMLGALAAATSRVKIIAGAILPVLRHPLQVAKDLATIDLLSKGRLIVMPTVSWHEQEYAALGVDFHKRGKMLDEQLAIWRMAWSQTPVSYHGEFYQFDDAYVMPKPWHPEGPPIWITGDRVLAPQLRRAIGFGSGFGSPGPMYPGDKEVLFAGLEAAGRDLAGFDLMGGIMGMFVGTDDVADWEQGFAQLQANRDFGATYVVAKPSQFVAEFADFPEFCRTFAARVKAIG
jgi:alkanesulfonate monooxygenase SsuD/methylene tetrahydromethanopterin reductase-like flavin-dependent oxidoreductase (luciferase family)